MVIMIKVRREGVVLRPTERAFETKAAFNPGVYQDGDDVHIIYRALDDNYQSSFGYARLHGPLNVV